MEVYKRFSYTDPYDEEFVKKYIGISTIEQYKNTEFYISTYKMISKNEKRNDATFNVMKYQYIDTSKLDDIFSQLRLLSKNDIISVLIVAFCIKIVKVYCNCGLTMYFTDRKTNRRALSWSDIDFKNFSKSQNLINQPYDEVYISVFYFEDMPYFLEHNELLDADDIGKIIGTIAGALAKMSVTSEA